MGIPFKYSGEILRAGKTQLGGNIRDRKVSSGQHLHGTIHLQDIDIVGHGQIDSSLENPGEVAGGDAAVRSNIRQGDMFLQVPADILDGLDDDGIINCKYLTVALGDLPGQQKDHLEDVNVGQRTAQYVLLIVRLRTDALHAGEQLT